KAEFYAICGSRARQERRIAESARMHTWPAYPCHSHFLGRPCGGLDNLATFEQLPFMRPAMTDALSLRRLNAVDADFSRHLDHLLSWESVSDDSVNQRVLEIIKAVRERGDAALVEYTQRFDGLQVASMADLILPRE